MFIVVCIVVYFPYLWCLDDLVFGVNSLWIIVDYEGCILLWLVVPQVDVVEVGCFAWLWLQVGCLGYVLFACLRVVDCAC